MRKSKLMSILAIAVILAVAPQLLAQTTTTYQGTSGSISSTLFTTMNLSGGGSVTLNPVLGPNCYYGMVCGFPAGYVGTYMSYSLPDGSVAQLNDFSGDFSPLGGNNYQIVGQASGVDNVGRYVTVDNVQVTMTISCRSGRGGGCSKTYTGGTFTLTENAGHSDPDGNADAHSNTYAAKDDRPDASSNSDG